MDKPSLNHSIRREHGFETLRVEGNIPSELKGTLYRTGPGLLERFGRPISHPFDADGALTAVRFSDQVQGATQIVKSRQYWEEEQKGRFLYGATASHWQQIKNNLTQQVKSTGNTNVLSWQNKIYALVENAKPVEIDAHTLRSRDVVDFDGIIPQAFSAHPHRVESLKTTFNFGIRGKNIDLFALPDAGRAERIATIAAPWIAMVHDFIATDTHLVFFIGPAKLVLWRALLGIGGLSKYFKWEPEAGMAIIVVPLVSPNKPIQFSVETFWVWHFVNAYQDNGDIVVDALRHDDFGAFAAPSSAGPEQSEPALYRYRINPKALTMTAEPLWQAPCEFPSIHPNYSGGKHRYVWLQTFPDEAANGAGVARFDTATHQLQRWIAPHGHLCCEPVFVPGGMSESNGWILQLIQDPTIAQSYLAILDAERLAETPLAKVWFRQGIPMTFHGVFVPHNGRC